MDIVLSDDLEKAFREEVFKQMGLKKGNLSLAIEEAIRLWMETQKAKRSGVAKKAWETRKNKTA